MRHSASRPRRRAEGERGATLVLFALVVTVLFVITALVIDLSFVRQNRQVGKSAADLSAQAGVQSLDSGFGIPAPWRGICAARDYLVANDATFAGMTQTYATGAGGPVSSPCSAPVNSTPCVDSVTSTWGVLTGLVDGGRLRVTISSGYNTIGSGFSEDTVTSYASDTASACLQLAVIVEEREEPSFGGVPGATGWTTKIRSVARAKLSGGEVAPAVLLLERTECQVLTVAGTGAIVEARGRDGAAGSIHADSNASVDCAANKKVFDVDGTPSAPAIRSLASPGGAIAGSITSRSLSTAGVNPSFTADSPEETCVQAAVNHCITSPTTGAALQPRGLVSRSVVDSRYRVHVRTQAAKAAAVFGYDSASAASAGYVVSPCDAPSFTGPKIFVDCGGGSFNGYGRTFPDNAEIVINGYVTFTGAGSGPLNLGNNTIVYLRGQETTGNPRAIDLGASGKNLVQNRGSSPTCTARYADSPTDRSILVIGSGALYASGGTIRLCQTAVLMLDTRDSACAVPASDGIPPLDNTCKGAVDVTGASTVDWTAPNVNDTSTPSTTELENFEDLALWSETASSQGISGSGGVTMGGLFFTPNAKPFTMNGGAGINLLNAQFITRKLRVTGSGVLTISPKLPNAVTLPALSGFSLVR